MISMSPSVMLKGAIKFSMKKLITGAEMASSTYTGPGEILMAPPFLGDITTIRLSGSDIWNVGKDAYMASTQGVVKDMKNQGISKAFFSGEGLFVYKISGTGLLWVSSFGAIVRKDVSSTCCYRCISRYRAHTPHSFNPKRSTSSITAISLLGTANILWSGSRAVVSSLASAPAKV